MSANVRTLSEDAAAWRIYQHDTPVDGSDHEIQTLTLALELANRVPPAADLHAVSSPGTLRRVATAESTSPLDGFLARWSNAAASERASRIHVVFALAAGGRLGVGNDPVYNTTLCFDPFPFPACDEAAKARIRALGEELDAHRKRVQAQHPGLSLTAMYNVLEALRAGRALTPKETATHDAGLVSVLRQLHDELDAAVATAYGWTRDGRPETDLTDAEILTRLVALNAARAAEEATGQIRWLRPDYQAPKGTSTQTGLDIAPKGTKPT